MRASIRGSMRSVMVTDSADSLLPRHRGFHQPQVGPVLGPEIGLGRFAVEDGHFFPVRK